MNLKIIEEKENPLLNRKNILAELEYSKIATPRKTEVKKILADTLKIGEELIELKHVYPIFGKNKAKVIAHIYKNIKDLENIEKIKKRAKKKVKKKVEESGKKTETKEQAAK